MRVYWEVGKRAFQRQLAYRTANVAGLVTNAFFGYMRGAIFAAAFAGQGVIAGYEQRDLITFTWVTQALIMVVNLWSGLEIGMTIRSGAIVSDLCKPFSYVGYWLARDFGRAVYFLVFRCAPILLVGQLLFGLRWPHAPQTWLVVLASLALANTVAFAWNFMLELTGFWTLDTKGVRALAVSVLMFMSGFVVPIRLFPGGLREVAMALPFATITQIPADVFLERYEPAGLLLALGQQALWAIVMLAAAQGLLALATRRLVTQGG